MLMSKKLAYSNEVHQQNQVKCDEKLSHTIFVKENYYLCETINYFIKFKRININN